MPSCPRHGWKCAIELHTSVHSTSFEHATPSSLTLAGSYVNESVPGECVASLQTCTLSYFAQRLMVQAWVTDVP